MMRNGIEERGLRIEDRGACSPLPLAGEGLGERVIPHSSIRAPDVTPGHSTRLPKNGRTGQRYSKGFSLVSAIFLLVVIAALGTFAVTLSTMQQQSAALDVLGSRAYQAARAGIEWAAFHVSQSTAGTAWAGCVPSTGLGSLGGTLTPFTVTVNCSAASYVEGASTVWIYDVSAVATAGAPGDPNYVERVIGVKMGK